MAYNEREKVTRGYANDDSIKPNDSAWIQFACPELPRRIIDAKPRSGSHFASLATRGAVGRRRAPRGKPLRAAASSFVSRGTALPFRADFE